MVKKSYLGQYEWQCPKCGYTNYPYLPYAQKGQKILDKCKNCGFQLEITIE